MLAALEYPLLIAETNLRDRNGECVPAGYAYYDVDGVVLDENDTSLSLILALLGIKKETYRG